MKTMSASSVSIAMAVGSVTLAVLLLVSLNACKVRKSKGDTTAGNHPDSSVVIWMKPGTDPGTFKSVIGKFVDKHNLTAAYCLSCDSSLVRLQGLNVPTHVVGELASGGTGTGGTVRPRDGGGDIGYWSYNFTIEINDAPKDSPLVIQPKPYPVVTYKDSTPIVVAVLDTGVDSTFLENAGMLYKSDSMSCVGQQGNNGWNFSKNNNSVQDNFNQPRGHGKIVSRLITDQVVHYKESPVKILPVVVFPDNGIGNLFSLLCGIAFARERGANVVNTSLGYYAGKKDEYATLLLREFVKTHLGNNNIPLVAAVGNDGFNLDNNTFYPACLLQYPDVNNVISVTTSYKTVNFDVAPNQNYSKRLALASAQGDDVYSFINPVNKSLVRGSSYATPVVAGTIAAYYKTLRLNTNMNNSDILNYLLVNGFIRQDNITLAAKVRQGLIFQHFR